MQGYSSIKTSVKASESFQPATVHCAVNSGTDWGVQGNMEALRVFLVEDSPVIRELIVEDLSDIPGVQLVGTAETEKEAIDELSELECDVMIVDIQLKQGNGINLLRALTERALQKNCLKLVLSNHVSGTYRRLCEQYGVRYFFDKTSEFSQLRALIARLRINSDTH